VPRVKKDEGDFALPSGVKQFMYLCTLNDAKRQSSHEGKKNTPKKLPKPAIFNQKNAKNALKTKKTDVADPV
jgi:hypothetical protein